MAVFRQPLLYLSVKMLRTTPGDSRGAQPKTTPARVPMPFEDLGGCFFKFVAIEEYPVGVLLCAESLAQPRARSV
jgi:hypothetical protein